MYKHKNGYIYCISVKKNPNFAPDIAYTHAHIFKLKKAEDLQVSLVELACHITLRISFLLE